MYQLSVNVCCYFSQYLHCSKAQNNPVFLLMVEASEFSTRKCPWAVQSTVDRKRACCINKDYIQMHWEIIWAVLDYLIMNIS